MEGAEPLQQVTEVKQVPEDPPETKKLLINHPGREYTCAEFAHLVDRLKDNRTTRRRLPRRRRQGRRQGRRRLPRRRRRLERRRRRLEHTVSITFLDRTEMLTSGVPITFLITDGGMCSHIRKADALSNFRGLCL